MTSRTVNSYLHIEVKCHITDPVTLGPTTLNSNQGETIQMWLVAAADTRWTTTISCGIHIASYYRIPSPKQNYITTSHTLIIRQFVTILEQTKHQFHHGVSIWLHCVALHADAQLFLQPQQVLHGEYSNRCVTFSHKNCDSFTTMLLHYSMLPGTHQHTHDHWTDYLQPAPFWRLLFSCHGKQCIKQFLWWWPDTPEDREQPFIASGLCQFLLQALRSTIQKYGLANGPIATPTSWTAHSTTGMYKTQPEQCNSHYHNQIPKYIHNYYPHSVPHGLLLTIMYTFLVSTI